MKILTFFLIILAACTTTSSAWVYKGSKELSAGEERRLFNDNHNYCDRKYQIAKRSAKEYRLRSDPKGAYEHCMQSQGWETVKLDD